MLGIIGQIVLGLSGVDLPADIRDIVYDIQNWQLTPEHAVKTALDAIGLIPFIGALKNSDEAAALAKGILRNSDEVNDIVKGAAKNSDEVLQSVGSKLKVIDGKVGGKVPVDDFNAIRKSSVKNPNGDSITLGKYTNDSNSYIAKAGKDSSYFDLGDEWSVVQNKYNLTDSEMFEYFNKPALKDAISSGKTIKFSHNPLDYPDTFLEQEWDFIKETLDLTDNNLVKIGDFWYVK